MARCLHALKRREEVARRVQMDQFEAWRKEAEETSRAHAKRMAEFETQQVQIQAATALAFSPWYMFGPFPGVDIDAVHRKQVA